MKILDRNFRQEQGIALVECIVYISLLAWLMGLAFAAYYRWEENSFRLQRNANDIVRAMKAGEQWREDVRSATGPLKLNTTPEEVSLRIPQSKDEIIYLVSERQLKRIVGKQKRGVTLFSNVKKSSMHSGERKFVSAWIWDLELLGDKKSKMPAQFSFQSVVPPKK